MGCKNILAHRLCYAEFFINCLRLLLYYMFSSSIWAGNLIDIDCKVQSVYGYRADGTPGRVVVINLKGECLKGNCLVDVAAKGYREKVILYWMRKILLVSNFYYLQNFLWGKSGSCFYIYLCG